MRSCVSRWAQLATRHGNTQRRSRFDIGCGAPRRRQVVGEHGRHEPLESRSLLFLYTHVVPSTASNGSGAGLDLDRPMLPLHDQVGVIGEHFLDEPELVVTVGEAVMDVEGRLRVSPAHGQPQMDQRLALVEAHRRGFGGRIVGLYHLDSRVKQIVDRDLMPPVGASLEVATKYRVRLQQRIEGSRQTHRRRSAPSDARRRPTKHSVSREYFLATRQVPNHRR